MAEGFEEADNKASLKEIVFDFYLNRDLKLEPFVLNGWLIEAVEYEATLDTADAGRHRAYPCRDRPHRAGYDGKRVVIDHKFLNDFYERVMPTSSRRSRSTSRCCEGSEVQGGLRLLQHAPEPEDRGHEAEQGRADRSRRRSCIEV
jgi:hypothetical protein